MPGFDDDLMMHTFNLAPLFLAVLQVEGGRQDFDPKWTEGRLTKVVRTGQLSRVYPGHLKIQLKFTGSLPSTGRAEEALKKLQSSIQ